MNDLISRQAAIDAMESVDWYHINKDGQLTHGANSSEDEPLYKAEDVYKVLNDMPSLPPNLQPTCNQLATDTISRRAAIDTEGLDEQIRCEMCKNPMHTDRGCDGHCKYDEKLYERIMQILDERIKPLPSAQPEIVRCKDCKHFEYDHPYIIQGVPVLGHEVCNAWGDGCKTDENGYCFLAERREDG